MVLLLTVGASCTHSNRPVIVDLGNGRFTASYTGERGENVLAVLDQ